MIFGSRKNYATYWKNWFVTLKGGIHMKKLGDVFRTIFWILSAIGTIIVLIMPDWYVDKMAETTIKLMKKMEDN